MAQHDRCGGKRRRIMHHQNCCIAAAAPQTCSLLWFLFIEWTHSSQKHVAEPGNAVALLQPHKSDAAIAHGAWRVAHR